MNFKKTKGIAVTLLALLLTLTAMFSVSVASAHTPPWNIITNAYVFVPINPIGQGQTAPVYFWLDKVYDSAALGNDYRFHNYQLTITAPDGTQDKRTVSLVNDPTSNAYASFAPTQIGTYTITFNFPGQAINDFSHSPTSAYQNDTYSASQATTTLTVQKDPIQYLPAHPLPTEYWDRPIYGENTNWWAVSSNWLGSGAPGYGGYGVSPNLGGNQAPVYPGDAVGPQTSHIMWTKPLMSGGVVGGNNFAIQGNQFYEGSAYNQRFTNPIIVNGKLYYKEPVSFTATTGGPMDCVDLRTGQLIWSRMDVPALSFAFVWDHEDPNQHGVFPTILFTSNFARAFDADTGNQLVNFTGVPSGYFATVLGPQGEWLRYVLANAGNTTNPDWRLGEWNSTRLFSGDQFPGTATGGLSPTWQNNSNTASPNTQWSYSNPMTNSFIVNGGTSTGPFNRYDWNVTIPWRNTMPSNPTIVGTIYNDLILMYNGTLPSKGGQFMGTLGFNPYTYFAVNLNPSRGAIGSILWMQTYNPPPGNLTVLEAGIDPVNRVFIETYREGLNYVGYSLDSGQKLWGPTASQVSLDYYGSQGSGSLASNIAYGKIYSSAYGGVLYCYDSKTGNLLWTNGNGNTPGNSTQSGYEVPGPYPTFISAIGNGVVYTITSEHTVETPIYKGATMRGINATDGTQIWALSNVNTEFLATSYAIADGYTVTFNGYDNQIYVVGRGPSKTTVTAPDIAITQGSSVVIRGTVTDISAGTKQDEQAARFPNGVPVVSDASMQDWMGYVYQQMPRPTDLHTLGVTVALTVTDSNHNTYSIGNATTDASGTYHLTWQPPIPGDYIVYANFEGTNGYWPSSAETAISVVTAAPASPQVTPTPTPTIAPTGTPTVPPTATPTTAPAPRGGFGVEVYVAIAAVAVIVVVIAAALVLRRRK